MRRILFLLTLLSSLSVHAYKLTGDFLQGYYWQTLPIQMVVLASDEEEGEDLLRVVEEAKAEWEGAVGAELWDFSAGYAIGSSPVKSFIRWSNNFSKETGFDENTVLAIAIRYGVGPYFAKTEIILNGKNLMMRNSEVDLKKVIIHELGHTIGLDHSNQTAIMAPSISSIETIQYDDIAGANAAYSETVKRQRTGYAMALATQSEQRQSLDMKALGCGSIGFVGDEGGSSGGGNNPLLSITIGLALVSLVLGLFNQAKRFRIRLEQFAQA